MKKTFGIGILSAAIACFVGCASNQGQQPPAQAADTRPLEQRLAVGMTKDEVRKALGNPTGTSINSSGEETWRYSDAAKAFIPFYSLAGGQFQHLTVNFNKDSKVKDWASTTQSAY